MEGSMNDLVQAFDYEYYIGTYGITLWTEGDSLETVWNYWNQDYWLDK